MLARKTKDRGRRTKAEAKEDGKRSFEPRLVARLAPAWLRVGEGAARGATGAGGWAAPRPGNGIGQGWRMTLISNPIPRPIVSGLIDMRTAETVVGLDGTSPLSFDLSMDLSPRGSSCRRR